MARHPKNREVQGAPKTRTHRVRVGPEPSAQRAASRAWLQAHHLGKGASLDLEGTIMTNLIDYTGLIG
jgi:hypothetical protein